MSGGWRGRLSGAPPPPRRKERDEDLVLFKELFKREQDRNVSLLEPVSDEFDPSAGNNLPYKLSSGKKGSGYDLFASEEKKNDYDWLKTPPATPLFPSLELEAGDLADMVMHKELPILQVHPIKPSRFGAAEKPKQRPKSPVSVSASSSRSATPRSVPLPAPLKPLATSPTTASVKPASHSEKKPNSPRSRSVSRKDNNSEVEVSKKPISGGVSTKLQSRGASPTPKPSFPTTLPGFTDETPPNLITSAPASRSTSATRGRAAAMVVGPSDSRPESRSSSNGRVSSSSNTLRGRKSPSPGLRVEEEQNAEVRGRLRTGNNGGSVVVGSRMVEKMMNARRAVERGGDKGPAVTSNATTAGSGFGRLMAKSSLDMALKNLDLKEEPREFLEPKTRSTNRNSKTSVPTRSILFDSEPPRVPAPTLRGQRIGNNGGGTVTSKEEKRNNNCNNNYNKTYGI